MFLKDSDSFRLAGTLSVNRYLIESIEVVGTYVHYWKGAGSCEQLYVMRSTGSLKNLWC